MEVYCRAITIREWHCRSLQYILRCATRALRTVTQEEYAYVVYCASIMEFEDRMGLVDLLQVRLRQAPSYKTAEHDGTEG